MSKTIFNFISFSSFLFENNYFIASGPQNPRTGGIILSQLQDRKKLEDILKDDPFQIHDIADYKMKDVSGNNISLNEIKTAKGLLVIFSCNTCPYVIKNQERTLAISKFAMENKVGVILLNSNEALRSEERAKTCLSLGLLLESS